ncbi:ABC transporter permease [Halorubellus salinus]|uniref:ABC transporter permease n=1 Tax=Halorubellus salinus TaxID=755309 RepID=UPI001D098A8C|nr:ABC transporter permease [Halorubellus salinus]
MSPPASEQSESVSQTQRFQDVDWQQASRRQRWPSTRTIAFLLGLGVLAGGFYYEHVTGHSLPLVANVEPLDWLFAASLLAIATFVVAPLISSPKTARRYWQRLRRSPTGLLSLTFVLAFGAVGILAPVIVSEPQGIAFDQASQPPLGAAIDTIHLFTPDSCLGPVTNGRCHGTLQYPFGTTGTGKDLLPFLVLGAHTALLVAVVSASLMVPIGIGVGLLAAYSDGRTDEVLMRIAGVSQTLPAVIVYLLFWWWNGEYRLLALILVFGVTNWGGLARLVRNEALQLQERPFVKAARATGATRLDVMRQHLLPNIAQPVITSVTLQLPMLIVTEAALSFIVLQSPFDGETVTLGDPSVVSWGQTINLGTARGGVAPEWWVAAIPGVLLVLTMLAFAILGRTLGDTIDPKAEN